METKAKMARMGGKGLTAWQRYKNYYMFVCPYFVRCFRYLLRMNTLYPIINRATKISLYQ